MTTITTAVTLSRAELAALQTEYQHFNDAQDFGAMRKRLQQAHQQAPDDVWVTQKLAHATYKDPELYPKHRLQSALNLLESIGLRDQTNQNVETLALGGAIYKRLWEFGGQLEHVYESLALYRAAYERDFEQDSGYGGTNAAYLLDLLAMRAETLARRNQLASQEAERLRQQAVEIREKVRDLLLSRANSPAFTSDYWSLVTLAEAYFGLADYTAAGEWLQKASQLKPSPKEWQLQTTFQQWVGIARQQGIALPDDKQAASKWHPAWKALKNLLGNDTAEALVASRGKVGLALSGGGFRASFFHLGVLARLAEVDALRGVDVLSTVSGGSILGSQYYLEVQRLLEDASKTANQDDFLDLVFKLQTDFLRGVQDNIRMLAFDNFLDNLRMLLPWGNYSRSQKLGDLYEQHLYTAVNDNKGQQPRKMKDLLVEPAHGKFQGKNFRPNAHNWRRRNKVPVLLLNTTSLNSGHNWFFTANWMGEPPGLIDIDNNARYRRLYYQQAPTESLQNFSLGHATAASSCVPGLFEPLELDKLFADHTIKLVDGGVHDNQGVQGLLDEGCNLILCSDASGQMEDVNNPAADPAGVLLRTVSVLQDRIREAEYQDLQERLSSGSLQGLFFIHTQKDLNPKPLDWIGCQDTDLYPEDNPITRYGIAKDLQTKIATLRTDLDSFTEVEAYALMASGYLMARQQLQDLNAQHLKDDKPGSWGGFEINAAQQRDWPFLQLQDLLAQPASSNSSARADLTLQLDTGKALFFKAWFLVPKLKHIGYSILALLAIALITVVASNWHNQWVIPVSVVVTSLLGIPLAMFMPALAWLNPKKEAKSLVIKLAMAFTGYLMAKLHLNLLDKLFLQRGKLADLLALAKNKPV